MPGAFDIVRIHFIKKENHSKYYRRNTRQQPDLESCLVKVIEDNEKKRSNSPWFFFCQSRLYPCDIVNLISFSSLLLICFIR